MFLLGLIAPCVSCVPFHVLSREDFGAMGRQIPLSPLPATVLFCFPAGEQSASDLAALALCSSENKPTNQNLLNKTEMNIIISKYPTENFPAQDLPKYRSSLTH